MPAALRPRHLWVSGAVPRDRLQRAELVSADPIIFHRGV